MMELGDKVKCPDCDYEMTADAVDMMEGYILCPECGTWIEFEGDYVDA
jgi:DNA-directed RNA polymerase subunit RPC12/RpoP